MPDKTGGCSPLNVSFQNITSGASANAQYQWDFGNGNISGLKNAGAVYYIENTYTVTLTVKDGTTISVKSKTITVYKKPAVDFTLTPAKGCLPFTVSFTSTEIAGGDGSLNSYYWDFGDGVTKQAYTPQINHTYNFQQTASVSLTAINSNGCTNTILKKNILNVLPALQADFSAEKNIYCQPTDVVRFLNNSNGPGTLSYVWDFGDGSTSTIKTPSHIYTQKGIYTVTLTVNSSEGCSVANTISLNIANFTNDFEAQPVICINTNATINNTSTPAPDYSTWVIDGTGTYNSYGSGSITPYIATAGIHTIQLTNNFGSCQEIIVKQIDVKPSLNLPGFIADITGLCGSPVKVNFKDTTSGAVKWLWNFTSLSNGTVSGLQAPSYIYTTDNSYTVSLTVSNAAGCSSSVSQPVYINKPLVGIFQTDANGYGGCEGITKSFMARSTEEITSYLWNFGDGATSTDKEPQHTFNQAGTYTVKLSYTTVNGCTGTVLFDNPITVQRKIIADFTGPVTVCGNTPVTFNSTSTGDINTIIWDYGDNTPGYGFYNTHKFQAEGDYTITFIALNYGCADTIVKKDYIHVSPPFPKIASFANTCDGDRGTATFTDASTQTDTWKWDFGDGSITNYTAAPGVLNHTYTKTGTYKAILTNTNGGCTVKDSVFVPVLLKQHPVLKADKSLLCSSNDIINIEIGNLEKNPYTAGYANDYNYGILYSDGSGFTGFVSGDINNLPFKGMITNIDPAKQGIQAFVYGSYFGCYDTTDIVPLQLKGPSPGFKILTSNTCFKTPASFQDTSKIKFNVPIVKWVWDFGDGISETKTQGGVVSHLYKDPGNYYVTLTVTDAEGCSANSPYYTSPVYVSGPRAAFIPSGTNIPLNTTVTFSNNTNTYNSNNTQYQWDFGDGSTSTDFSPSHTYTLPGTYKVELIATDPATQCSDIVSETITVKNFNYAFSISTTFIANGGHCAPAVVNFTNTSSDYTRIVWDFGDGFTLENQNYPSHIYKEAGTYIVTLFVYGFNGLTGTYKDTVKINSSTATIKADITGGCKGLPVKLNAPVHTNTVFYAWDFGDGNVITTTDSFAVNNYLLPGTYRPSLISTDVNGCSASIPLADQIVIRPDPIVNITPANPILCKGKTVQLSATGAISYTWSPADGLDNITTASPNASPANTVTYSVKAKDDKGCTGAGTVTVTVAQPFKLQSNPVASICIGNNIQLNTSGADLYKWVNETTGLNNTGIANPLASPAVTTNYTVVGYDQYQCFTDTAFVKITVNPLPTVEAGPDIEATIGSDIQLHPAASSDVTSWVWSPADYLSCTDCATPVSKPRSPVDYTITVYNQYNCSAKGNIKINVVCAGGQIYIPAAFSPNNDGKNDRFVILGNGVKIVKSLRIFNRWGEMIFERKNFYPDDANAAWDGNYKNFAAPAGIYVYIAETECNASETFTRKGTVTLIR